MSISPIHLRVNPYVKDETIRPRSGADAEARQESFMEKRLRETGEALERLRAMPLRNSVQMAAEKVEMLKRRLEEIRVNLMFMTPEQAKAYARELKQIAGALSEAARNAGLPWDRQAEQTLRRTYSIQPRLWLLRFLPAPWQALMLTDKQKSIPAQTSPPIPPIQQAPRKLGP